MVFRFKLNFLKNNEKKILKSLFLRDYEKKIYFDLINILEKLKEKMIIEKNFFKKINGFFKNKLESKKKLKILRKELKKLLEIRKEKEKEIPNLLNDLILDQFSKKNLNSKIIFKKIFKNTEKNKETYLQLERKYGFLKKNKFANFFILNSKGVEIERNLINKCILFFKNKEFEEIGEIPLFYKKKTFINTGQFPKLKNFLFPLKKNNFYLIPTAETAFVNIFENFIFQKKDLGKNFFCLSECFRNEKGQKKKLKNRFRMFQFKKLELFFIDEIGNEYEKIKKISNILMKFLDSLEISYRLILNNPKNISFQASISFDLEIYLENSKEWIEISTISSCSDFQSKKMNLKYVDKNIKKFCYTYNASGFGFSRLFLGYIEKYGI